MCRVERASALLSSLLTLCEEQLEALKQGEDIAVLLAEEQRLADELATCLTEHGAAAAVRDLLVAYQAATEKRIQAAEARLRGLQGERELLDRGHALVAHLKKQAPAARFVDVKG